MASVPYTCKVAASVLPDREGFWSSGGIFLMSQSSQDFKGRLKFQIYPIKGNKLLEEDAYISLDVTAHSSKAGSAAHQSSNICGISSLIIERYCWSLQVRRVSIDRLKWI